MDLNHKALPYCGSALLTGHLARMLARGSASCAFAASTRRPITSNGLPLGSNTCPPASSRINDPEAKQARQENRYNNQLLLAEDTRSRAVTSRTPVAADRCSPAATSQQPPKPISQKASSRPMATPHMLQAQLPAQRRPLTFSATTRMRAKMAAIVSSSRVVPTSAQAMNNERVQCT